MITFGTGGWRAVIGEDFIKSNIQRIAAGLSELPAGSQIHQRSNITVFIKADFCVRRFQRFAVINKRRSG